MKCSIYRRYTYIYLYKWTKVQVTLSIITTPVNNYSLRICKYLMLHTYEFTMFDGSLPLDFFIFLLQFQF